MLCSPSPNSNPILPLTPVGVMKCQCSAKPPQWGARCLGDSLQELTLLKLPSQ